MIFVGVVALVACRPTQKAPQVEGHYTYEHDFSYEMDGNRFEVSETGTMDFRADGTALDSARQVYFVTFADDSMGCAQWVFNYISPSRWHVESDTLYFAGIKEQFRMELVAGNKATALAHEISDMYGRSIDYEYKFHLDTLTAEKLQWSFTYRDGHSDTWVFNRK